MKKAIFFVCSMLMFTVGHAQRNVDIGVFAGTNYYLGDINPSKQFYSPSFSVGGLCRYNLNPRYSIRGSVFYGGLSGDDRDFDNLFQSRRDASFDANVLDATLQFEFNFLPYSTWGKRREFSTYVAGGIGFAFFNSSGGYTYELVLPFGVGFKINLAKRLSAGVEWGFRKTFYDELDGLENWSDPEYKGLFHNYDWYSVAGIFVTYKIFDARDDCPAYWDYQPKKR
ncbi:MAG: hypothetical protein JSV24_10145 [Bacteroidales bacterium]|nr:MAG: hypothetical protein JSV24_10145 [Bacteroidales bacterium]